MQLGRFPRVALAHLPTPLEPLPRLSAHLGGPEIWVKRDDCTGLATGGNKTRKLEFLLGAAGDADVIITAGGLQSNHARQTAAAAARLGLDCELVLSRESAYPSPEHGRGGNLLLDRLLGARIHTVATEAERPAAMEVLAGELRAQGRRPCVIPGGGSTPVGALGYVGCAFEIVAQANAAEAPVDAVVVASGGGGTQGGLVAGMTALNAGVRVIGIDIDAEPEAVAARVAHVAAGTLELLAAATPAPEIELVAGHAGPAYGVPTPEMREAVSLLARLEGLVLDPVYTGKAMAGLIDLVAGGTFEGDARVVFVHTGGVAGLFPYREVLEDL